MKKILIIIATTMIVNTLLLSYILYSQRIPESVVKPSKDSHFIYSWRRIYFDDLSDQHIQDRVDIAKRRNDDSSKDWIKTAWDKAQSVDLDGWDYVGTLCASSRYVTILVRKRVLDS